MGQHHDACDAGGLFRALPRRPGSSGRPHRERPPGPLGSLRDQLLLLLLQPLLLWPKQERANRPEDPEEEAMTRWRRGRVQRVVR